MKKTKTLGLLCGALLIVSAAAFGISRIQTQKEKIKSGESVILEIPGDSVTALSWKTEHADLAFKKSEDGGWSYTGDEAFPVNKSKMEELISSFKRLESAFTIEEVKDTSQYGLDQPVCTINLTADGKDYTVSLGGFSNMDSKRYAAIGDDKVYLLKNDLVQTFDLDLPKVIENDKLPKFDRISSVNVQGVDKYSFTRDKDKTLSYCETDQYYRDGKPLDTEKVEAYLLSIRSLGLSEYASYNVTDEELKSYGLDLPVLSVDINYGDENADGVLEDGSFKMELGINSEELAKAVKAGSMLEDGTFAPETENGDKTSDKKTAEYPTFYLRVNGSKIVYKIPEAGYRKLIAAKYNDLRHDHVLTASFDSVTSIDINLDGESYTLTSKGNADDKAWYYQDKEIDLKAFSNAFKGIKVETFTDESPSDKEEISITLHLNHEKFKDVKISFCRKDGTSCVAQEGGQTTGLVPRSSVVELIEAVNAFVL